MQRDLFLLREMIDAAEQARSLAAGRTVAKIDGDRLRRDALLWNFTVLGEAAGVVSAETKARFPCIPWRSPARLRNRVVHGYWSVDVGILRPRRRSNSTSSSAAPRGRRIMSGLDELNQLAAQTFEGYLVGKDLWQ